ncbi:MAG: leucine-rich repeat domain-containing protein [Candidatus Aminicenantes bacterium]|nr:MAG: leucine-rich repeat domain-containing protein [Candidatus Aminicenantes bacterium]
MSKDLEIIKRFEKQIGITLKEQPIEKLRIRGSYSLDRNGNVTGLNLRRLRRLDLIDISPLKELKQLTFLDLRNNKLAHLLPIRHLKNLTHLYLSNIHKSDISPINELTQLTVLHLCSNNLYDISPIEKLKQLTVLHLGTNLLSDISPIKGLKQLSKLDLGNNNIYDISPIRELKKLTKLVLSNNNNLTHISPIKELKQLTYLDLRSNKLSDIDISPIKELKGLTKLYLDNNYISDISPIEDLTGLSHLYLSSNHINDISPLMELTQLIQLNLGRNQLSDISPIKKLIKLNALDLRCNQLSDSDISPIKELKQLTKLDLSNNNISNISPIKELKQLTNLDLSNNNLSNISFIKDLKNLTHLCLNYNQISDISPIRELTHLKRLFLRNNRLSDISPIKELKKLTSLDLRNNKITHLFVELTDLDTDMEYWSYKADGNMLLSGNPLKSPPIEIAVQGKYAVINYFKELEEAPVRLLESKLLIVGNGAVGKTTLMRKLKDNDFKVEKGEEATIHGINIESWKLHCDFQTADPGDVNIHIWDFGGQDIYRNTHQYFLTKRSLYLLVWEARRDGDVQGFDYWINIIKLKSDNSPVIVVMNKLDISQKNLDEASLKERFKNIVGFFRVSCVTGEGIKELTEQIRESLSRMLHLHDLLPKRWKDIQEQLYIKSKEKDYISLKEYFDLCQSFGLKEKQAEYLSDYLHDLGVILHFRKDKLLEGTVFLKPEWATDAVYKLIDTQEIQKNMGRFEFDKLKEYWNSNKFPRSIHNELIRLMENFELCFNLQETDIYIIPELLPVERPPISFDDYNKADNLRFEYHYDFMPAGIISRFISRNHYWIKNDHFWKNGVEIKFYSSTALVMSEPSKKEMKISISGSIKDQLLAIIRKEFEHIHQTLNLRKDDRSYSEMIPCNCITCIDSNTPHLFTHEVLRKASEKGLSSILCYKGLVEVSIEKLLKGFEIKPSQEDLLKTIINTANLLQGVAKSIKPDENSRNTHFSRFLQVYELNVKDQSRWGRSETGKSMGSPDIKIENSKGKTLAIIEAFNLKRFHKNYIDRHLIKLFGYDPSGLEKNFIIVYSDANDFSGLWKKYLDNIHKIDFQFTLTEKTQNKTGYAEIKLAETKHMREGKEVSIFHLFINMNPK